MTEAKIWQITSKVFPSVNFPHTPNDMAELEVAIIKHFNFTRVTSVFHEFSPEGLSGVIVISESHVGIHTWPEHSFIHLDYVTCSPVTEKQVRQFNTERFNPLFQSIKVVEDPTRLTSLILAKWTALRLRLLEQNHKA